MTGPDPDAVEYCAAIAARVLEVPLSVGQQLFASPEGLAVLDRLIELKRLDQARPKAKPSPHLRSLLQAVDAWGPPRFSAAELRHAAEKRPKLAQAIAPIVSGKQQPANALGKFLLTQSEVAIDGLRFTLTDESEGVNYFQIVKDQR